MANIAEILAALQNLPRAYNAPPVTPTFTGAPLPAGLPNTPLALTTAGQAPTPQYGGPSQVTEPPQAPFDPTIIAQLLATQGPAPQAPAPLSRGQRIANALIGFGAGVQGNLPQFLQQLQEPQRQYQRQLADYNAQRAGLKERGVEIGLRQQENKTRRAQELENREFQAESDREARRLKLTDDRERQLLNDLLLSRRQREDDERAAKLAEQRDRAAKETQRNNIYSKLISENFAPVKVANEIADNIVHGKPLSVATEKWRSLKAQKLEAQLNKLNAAGGGEKDVREIIDKSGNVIDRLPINKIPFDQNGMIKGYPPGSKIRAPLTPTPAQLPATMFPEFGGAFSGVQSPAAAPEGGHTYSRAEVKAAARRMKRKPADVEADLKARGNTVK